MTVRTPGYPALIAIGEWLNLPTNFTLVAINAVCASIVTTWTFIVLHRHTRKATAIIATSFVLLNPSLLWQYSMASRLFTPRFVNIQKTETCTWYDCSVASLR
jgi:hypothetical protein